MVRKHELIEDGQEEVFSRTAVERGLDIDPLAMPIEDIRAAELIEALGALVQQIDISDYRDSHGHPAKGNLAFLKAQHVVDRYGVSHAQICQALDKWGDDIAGAARGLSGDGAGREPAP